MDEPGNLGGNCRQTWRLAVLDEVVSLSGDELDRLLDALARLGRDGGTVAEQIAALRLVGGVLPLTPTEAELVALEEALAAVAAEGRPVGPTLRPVVVGVGADSPHERRS